MPREPDNLVLTLLREIRSDIGVLREHADEHSEGLRALRTQIRDWQETTATATGFAVHASIRGEAIEREIADLKKRVEKLDGRVRSFGE
ncbi:MAG: hypothetical protein JO288_15575 [Hyphomicrobiales bacterium]|nr:hypothetical protein [Hyphomicrobiales bacterium]